MATNFGTVSCDYVRAQKEEPAQRTMNWFVPGFDGVGLALVGKSLSRFQFMLELYGSNIDVNTWFTALRALGGTIVGAEDDTGTEHENLYVETMTFIEKEPRVDPADANVKYHGAMLAGGVIIG